MNLNFDDGFITQKINGDENRVLRWNPTDINFIDRFIEFERWINGNEFRKLLKLASTGNIKVEDGELKMNGYTQGDMMKLANKLNERLDKTFNSNVSEVAFLGAHPLTPTKSGFIFANFVEAVSPIIGESFKENNEGMEKYISASKQIKKNVKGK